MNDSTISLRPHVIVILTLGVAKCVNPEIRAQWKAAANFGMNASAWDKYDVNVDIDINIDESLL